MEIYYYPSTGNRVAAVLDSLPEESSLKDLSYNVSFQKVTDLSLI